MSAEPNLLARVKRALLRLGGPPSRLGVAVSGGADSVCLLLLLRELGQQVAVLHVNHLLRAAESDADEQFVRELAARLNAPCLVTRVDVRARGGNLEEQARGVRYAFYREAITSGQVDCVATGHTMSDQAETVLFRMMRGAHLAGLAAIHPISEGPIVRPLIEVSRTEVEQYLRTAGEGWRDDSSNCDLTFDRNRIRHTLVPMLKNEWNPELERSLGHLAALAYDEERFWQEWMKQNIERHLAFRGNIALASASNLTEQPVALARRVVRRAIEHVKGSLQAIDFAHIEAILNLARKSEGAGRLQVPQVDVYRSFDWVRFSPLPSGDQLTARNQAIACEVPGCARLPLADVAVDLEVIENSEVLGASEVAVESDRVEVYKLDWDRVLAFGNELLLRTWKPGDQYTRTAGSACKVKTMFQEARIPLWERGTWPIITVASKIIWSREFGPAVEVAVQRETRRYLRIRDWRMGWIPENE